MAAPPLPSPGIQVRPRKASLLLPPCSLLHQLLAFTCHSPEDSAHTTEGIDRPMLPWSLFPRPAPGTGSDAEPEPSEPSGRQLSDEALVEELLTNVASARSFQEFRRSQRKECFGLLRWLQLVLPLIQEIRETAPSLTDDAYRRLALLGRAFQAARRLLRCCHDGSKIFLVIRLQRHSILLGV